MAEGPSLPEFTQTRITRSHPGHYEIAPFPALSAHIRPSGLLLRVTAMVGRCDTVALLWFDHQRIPIRDLQCHQDGHCLGPRISIRTV